MLRHFTNVRRQFALSLFALMFALCVLAVPSRAQLATSFSNVTSISAQSLPNAVRITIQTDGTAYFGGEQKDFINFDNTYEPKAIRSFRLRVLGARARLPAFVPLDQYPVDSASVSIAPASFEIPYFRWEAPQYEPHVDIELRFYVPVKIRRFSVRANDNGLRFGNTFGPNDVNVEPSQNGNAIIVTVFTDRADSRSQSKLRRSPTENQKHRLQIEPLNDAKLDISAPNAIAPNATAPNATAPSATAPNATAPSATAPSATAPSATAPSAKTILPNANTTFRADVLHSPLGSVLERVSAISNVPLSVSREAEDLDVSLLLPRATLTQFLETLSRGYGLNVSLQNEGFRLARGLSSTRTDKTDASPGDSSRSDSSPEGLTQDLPLQKFALQHLRADRARALLPDFLLPAIRVDSDNNTLLVSAAPAIAQKIGRDLKLLDVPRAQFRVEAQLWEFVSSEDADFALETLFQNANVATQSSTRTGSFALNIGAEKARSFVLNLTALENRGRVRLRARPFVVVASGENGTMFFGQTRYVTVFNGYDVNALQLQIGTSLEVTPRVGNGNQIALDLHPRFSTVDAIDDKTRLPTLGIREFRTTTNVNDGEAIVVSGIDSDLDFSSRNKSVLAFKTTQRNAQTTKSVLLVTARRVS